MPIIKVENLSKSYGKLKAVDDVSFGVKKGEIFGILGPNGAGKTTTLEMIETIRPIDSGNASVSDIDVKKHPKKVKHIIGVQLQSTSLFDYLTVAETISLFASFYGRKVDVKKILDEVVLQEKAKEYIPRLSGGQKQRVSIALALVNEPKVVFLDEPTTGLDPQARRHLWDVIRNLQKKGKSVVITTHYMEEAEVLCDRIAIMDHANIMEIDTPKKLINKFAAKSTIEFVSKIIPLKKIESLPAVDGVKSTNSHRLIFTQDSHLTLKKLITLSDKENFEVKELHTRRGTLEDVFISLTGRSLRD